MKMLNILCLGVLLLNGFVTANFAEYNSLGVPYLYTDNPVTPLPRNSPWGDKAAYVSNPWPDDPPSTGVIRSYDFTVSRQYFAPDGYLKKCILVNGQFPGPLIEANWGDTIQVTVNNNITEPEEGTSIHWHGLLQKGTPWMDGVPAISQCPITPGGSFTYTFTADSYGSSWYHSHFDGQYADGVFGPMIIHGPQTVSYDQDMGPVFVTDWNHHNYTTINEALFIPNFTLLAIPSDNSLINGRNNFNCSSVAPGDDTPCYSDAGLATFQFTAGKKHLLRVINAGASALQTFSIDGHNMTVIANDFVPLVPYQTQFLTLGVGQRSDVIVEGLPNATGSYFMRSQSPSTCANTLQPNASAIVYYENEYVPEPDPWPAYTNAINNCENIPLNETVPYYPIASNPDPATTWNLDITLAQNGSGAYLWYMNNSTFRGNYNHPVLLLSNLGNTSYPDDPQWNVENFGSNSSIRIVVNNDTPRSHPMHLHGHNFLVEAIGNGIWDGQVVRASNPQRRDTQLVPGYGYMVISFETDNPGAWPFHCHVAWHVASGLYVTILERPDEIPQYKIPSTLAQTCRDWWAYTNTTVVDQIDSGL